MHVGQSEISFYVLFAIIFSFSLLLVGVILHLLTFGGIAHWLNYHGFLGKRPKSKVKKKALAEVCVKSDFNGVL